VTTWTIKALPRGDEDEPGDVTIERDDAHIIVHWVCGASRTFTPAALRRALGLFEAVIANDGTGDLWYGDSDSPGQAYVARLDNGNFVADANIVETGRNVKETDMSDPSFRPFGKALALATITAAALLCGCHAKEAPTSQFIPQPALMARDETLPFNRAYWNHKYDPKSFTEIVIAPVNIQYVMAQNFWEKASSAGISPEKAKNDIQELADYTRESVTRAFANDPKHRFKVVQEAGPQTFILELALTQVVPSKAALNAIDRVVLRWPLVKRLSWMFTFELRKRHER